MRKEKFSIRKFTVGTASVLVGAAILAGGANVDLKPAAAEESTEETQSASKGYDTEEEAIQAGYALIAESDHTGFSVEEFGGSFYVELNYDGTTPAVQLQPADPVVKEYTATYELRDKDGNVLEVLQTAEYNDWAGLESGSVAVADSFVEEYGNWDVVATAEGLTYVFTKVEEEAVEDGAQELSNTAFDNEKDAIVAGHNYLASKGNVQGHDGFDVKEFGGKFYVELNFNGVTPALELEPAPEKEEADKEFTAKFEVRDQFGNVLEELQTATYEDWAGLESGSVAIANTFVEEHGNWDVEATAEGFTYVFTKAVDKAPELAKTAFDSKKEAVKAGYDYLEGKGNVQGHDGFDVYEFGGKFYVELNFNGKTPALELEPAPEKEEAVEEFTVKYVVRDAEGNEVEVLQTEKWNDWKAMETASVAVADVFAEDHGKWDVEATANGLTYVFTKDVKAEALAKAKEEAIKAIKEAGVTSDYYEKLINNAKTIEGVEALRDEILKAAPQPEEPEVDEPEVEEPETDKPEDEVEDPESEDGEGDGEVKPEDGESEGDDEGTEKPEGEESPDGDVKGDGAGDGEDAEEDADVAKDGDKVAAEKAEDKKEAAKDEVKEDGKELPDTGEAQSGILATAAALLGAAGLFLIGRRRKAEK